jgi:hypothetical protein
MIISYFNVRLLTDKQRKSRLNRSISLVIIKDHEGFTIALSGAGPVFIDYGESSVLERKSETTGDAGRRRP